MTEHIRKFKELTLLWNDENGVLRVQAAGQINLESVDWILSTLDEIVKQDQAQLALLIPMNQIAKVTPRARKAVAKIRQHKDIRKIAYFGGSTFMRTLVNPSTAATGRKNTRQFPTEEEALRWLLEE
ncbi:MAG: STAS/SEC14 domain-containing protein [Anaerolineales bacterium]|nr:STAS/SEC14 domain-containing protein [Chloroflexota bacterium]MBL6982873.1 STAS/SEC14 domain-containing protein [Anaerolineales bacterium]